MACISTDGQMLPVASRDQQATEPRPSTVIPNNSAPTAGSGTRRVDTAEDQRQVERPPDHVGEQHRAGGACLHEAGQQKAPPADLFTQHPHRGHRHRHRHRPGQQRRSPGEPHPGRGRRQPAEPADAIGDPPDQEGQQPRQHIPAPTPAQERAERDVREPLPTQPPQHDGHQSGCPHHRQHHERQPGRRGTREDQEPVQHGHDRRHQDDKDDDVAPGPCRRPLSRIRSRRRRRVLHATVLPICRSGGDARLDEHRPHRSAFPWRNPDRRAGAHPHATLGKALPSNWSRPGRARTDPRATSQA